MWEGVGDRTELQHINPYSIVHNRFFPVLLGCSTGGPEAQVSAGCLFLYNIISPSLLVPKLIIRGPEGPNLLGAGFLYCILSPTRLIPNCSIWSPEGPFSWVLAFFTASCLQTDWISCALSYMLGHRPLNLLPQLAIGICTSAVFGMACLIVIEQK